jgi:sugar phosphate isomerase/epimerase
LRLCAFTDEISLDFEAALRTCAENGVREIQIRRVDGSNVVELPEEAIDRLVRLTRDYGVRVAGIGSPFGKPPAEVFAAGLDDAAGRQHRRVFDRALALAKRFDAPMIRVFAVGAPSHDPDDFEARIGTSVAWLREPAELAAKAGRFLTIENEYTTLAGTCRQVRRAIDLLGHPNIRIAWDVASSWWDGESIADGYAHAQGLIADVHVRDVAPDPTDPSKHGPIVRFGEGAIDWAGIVGRLVADGYDGTLTLETHLYSQDPDRWTKLPAASMHAAAELRELIAGAREGARA